MARLAWPRSPRRARPRLAGGGPLLQWLAMGLLGLGLAGLQPSLLLGGLAIGLGVLTTLKLLEARSLEEHRLVGLLQLVGCGVVAALRPDLGPSLLLATATLVALSGLLALELGEGLAWPVLLRRSAQVLAAALPVTLVLFLLLPRLGPITPMPGDRGASAATGLSDRLDPGSIAALATRHDPAARVAFSGGQPPPPGERYWRVLVHDRFDGRAWSSGTPLPRHPDDPRQPPRSSASPTENGQLWLVEPSGLAAVPWNGWGRPLSRELLPDPGGELLHRGPPGQRRAYALGEGDGTARWQRQPPLPGDLLLPEGANPRLEALGARWAQLGSDTARLQAAGTWFRSQPFRYSLEPGLLPSRAPLDTFLFERRLGFCGHYASAFTALMRSAGVPARVVSGYRGGSWVRPLGGVPYLDLRQSDAHAWSQVWLQGRGWVEVDPTAWVAEAQTGQGTRGERGALVWLQQQWWGLDIAWTRLWLGFDREGQESLVRRLLGAHLNWLGALLVAAVATSLALGLGLLGWLARGQGSDPWRRERDSLLRALARHGLTPEPGDTLAQVAARGGQRWPALAQELEHVVALYQRHWFAPRPADARRPSLERRQLGELRRSRRQLQRQLGRLAGRLKPGCLSRLIGVRRVD